MKSKTIVVSPALLFLLFLFSSSLTQSQLTWQKDPNNPILSEWSGGVNDPSGYKYLFEPGVIYDSNLKMYRMWFSSLAFGIGTRFSISEAVSIDGSRWFTYVKNPVLEGTNGGSTNQACGPPKVVYDGNIYKMYYTGWSNSDLLRLGVRFLWMGKPGRGIKPHSCPWLCRIMGLARAIMCDVRYEGGTYIMWYSGSNGTTWAIGVATSTDGINWTKNTSNPVLQRSSSGWG